jgi:hypothetical protein
MESINRHIVDELMAGIRDSDLSIDESSRLLEMKTYYNLPVETDLSIHIYWESETCDQRKSPLAIRIHSALTTLGLLSHSLWIQKATREFKNRTAQQTPRTDLPNVSGALATSRKPNQEKKS